MILGIIFSIRLTRPIKQLTLAMEDFAQQRSSKILLPIDQGDEVGVLARTFKSMTQQVEESQTSLHELNNNLETIVSERTKSLMVSEAHQRTILETIGDAIITLDEQCVIISFNPAAERIFGYKSKQAVGIHISNLFPPNKREKTRQYSDKLSNHPPYETSQTKEYIGLRQNGSLFPLELNMTPMQGKDTDGFVGILRDITERKQTEAELEKHRKHLEELVQERTSKMQVARDEAQRANAAKSEFLSHMSHELRTPMNAILGFAQMLELDAAGFNKTQCSNVKEILDAGHHLLNLINEVLDLSKIESGKLELSIEEVSIDRLIQQCTSLIQPQAKLNHVQLFDAISNQGHMVYADLNRLKQIVLNLLSNAVKYNRIHGRITLEAELIEPQYLRIRITDTGEGLTEQEIANLFNPFERLNAVNNVEGSGIGLVITKHLIELMGGSIGVESTPGKGCSFWVQLESV